MAINLADSLGRLDHRVLLIDADIYNASLAQMLGSARNGHTIATLFAALNRNSSVNLKDFTVWIRAERLALVPGLASPDRWRELSPEGFSRLIAAAASFDFVVFDVAGDILPTGQAGDAQITRFLVREATHLLVIADSSILGIDRLARVAATVRRLRPDGRFDFVLNRASRKPTAHADLFHQLTKERFTNALPYDRKTLSAALERGCTASAIRQRGEFAKAMLTFAAALITP
ncbi:MAG: hypothetical protein RIS80_1149 [Actinomycetota bacterium]